METMIDKLAWIYTKDHKVLMARSKGNTVWYFPGGKREQGETDHQALVREIKEELGIELIPETLQFVKKFQTQAYGKPEGTLLQTTYYTGKFLGQPKACSEIEAIEYINSNVDSNLLTEMGHVVFTWLKQQGLID